MSITQTMSSEAVDMASSSIKSSTMNSGGRAWTEDEEAYLLRVRVHKMPYKHIAAHLNKTELACRLHYHQLRHGNNRRKRGASATPSLDMSPGTDFRTATPARSLSPPQHREHDLQLPSINSMDGHRDKRTRYTSPITMQAHGTSPSPSLMPAHSVLPRVPMASVPSINSRPMGYSPLVEPRQRTPLPSISFSNRSSPSHSPERFPSTSTHTPAHVDMARLHNIYSAHRDKFWDTIAKEYGYPSWPSNLERAWKTGRCCSPVLPPLASPKEDDRFPSHIHDKTRISSILSSDEDHFDSRNRQQESYSPIVRIATEHETRR